MSLWYREHNDTLKTLALLGKHTIIASPRTTSGNLLPTCGIEAPTPVGEGAYIRWPFNFRRFLKRREERIYSALAAEKQPPFRFVGTYCAMEKLSSTNGGNVNLFYTCKRIGGTPSKVNHTFRIGTGLGGMNFPRRRPIIDRCEGFFRPLGLERIFRYIEIIVNQRDQHLEFRKLSAV